MSCLLRSNYRITPDYVQCIEKKECAYVCEVSWFCRIKNIVTSWYIMLTSPSPSCRLCAAMDLKFFPDESSPQLVVLGSVVQLGRWQHIVVNVLPTPMDPVYNVRSCTCSD